MSFVQERKQRIELTFPTASFAERNETQGFILDTSNLDSSQLLSWFIKRDHHPSKGDGNSRLKFCRANPLERHDMGLSRRGSG